MTRQLQNTEKMCIMTLSDLCREQSLASDRPYSCRVQLPPSPINLRLYNHSIQHGYQRFDEANEMKLISARPLAIKCAWHDRDYTNDDATELLSREALIPVCPEQSGGLSSPRAPRKPRAVLVKPCLIAEPESSTRMGMTLQTGF